MKAVKPAWGNLGRQKTANPEDGDSATDHAMGMALPCLPDGCRASTASSMSDEPISIN